MLNFETCSQVPMRGGQGYGGGGLVKVEGRLCGEDMEECTSLMR